MEHIELGSKKYPRVKIDWMDIAGDCTTVGADNFEELTCALITTEAYLYDTFDQDGKRYLRTFASYEAGVNPSFGDRNVFPFSVLSKDSKDIVKKAMKLQKSEKL